MIIGKLKLWNWISQYLPIYTGKNIISFKKLKTDYLLSQLKFDLEPVFS